MGKKLLLDCTLRDGGYLNDWEFGKNNLLSVFERLTDSDVDVVEVGFLDDRRPFDHNRSIAPDTASYGKIWGNIAKRPGMVVGMIDYGTCAIENLESCENSFLDGIRVIFKKHRMYEALDYCEKVKSLGYKVFVQLVSITSYDDEDLMRLIELVNKVEPYAVSIVDTYGLLHPMDLLHYADVLDKYVKSGIMLGFHAHNNLQLAYANAITFLDRKTERDIVVDGTLFGMGKSAGNAPLELLGMVMNNQYGKAYHIQPMLEAIEESIKGFYAKSSWGYKPFFYLGASNQCHPSYVDYFQKKGNLSVSKLYDLLSQIWPEEKKLLYDKDLAENLYQEYVKNNLDDHETYDRLRGLLSEKTLLLIGPGKNIKLQIDKVNKFIEKEKPVMISVNYIPDQIQVNYVFVTKTNRYQEMTEKLQLRPEIEIIATTNLECKNGKFEYVVNRKDLLEEKEEIKDNSLLMLLKVLKHAGIKKVFCAGFDGYSMKEDNYAEPGMEYDFVKSAATYLNLHIRDVLGDEFMEMGIEFITYSHYCDIEDCNNATF